MAADFMDDDGLVKTRIQLAGSLPQTDASTTPIVQQINFNGASWDRVRNNTQGTLLATAARTANTVGPLVTNYNAKGIFIRLSINSVPVTPGTGGLSIMVQTGDGSIILLSQATKLTATGIYGYMIYPGIGAGTGGSTNQTLLQTASFVIPRTLYISVAHGDSQSYTYDVSYTLIL